MSKNGVIQIHGRDYKTVALRVQEFREAFPLADGYGIHTELLSVDEETVVMRAWITTPAGVTVAVGHAEEKRSNRGINATSALENCETSAVGRALAAAGFGGDEYASADEVAQAIRQQNGKQASKPAPKKKIKATPISDQQRKMIHRLGGELFGEAWEATRHELIAKATEGTETETDSLTQITADQASSFITWLQRRLEEAVEAEA